MDELMVSGRVFALLQRELERQATLVEWASEDRAKLEEKAVELEEEISATKLELECIQGMYEDTF